VRSAILGKRALKKGTDPSRQYRFVTESSLFGKGQSPFSTGCQTISLMQRRETLMRADADCPSPVNSASNGRSSGGPCDQPSNRPSERSCDPDSATAGAQEPEATAAPLPPEVDRTPTNIWRDRKPAALVDMAAAGPSAGPLKKGTVPPGNIDLARRVPCLERDSPRFQLAAQAMRRTSLRPTPRRNTWRSPSRLANDPHDWQKPREFAMVRRARRPLTVEGQAPHEWRGASFDIFAGRSSDDCVTRAPQKKFQS
jgi:hypothetical protein